MNINYPNPTIIHNTDLQKSKQINLHNKKTTVLGLEKYSFSGWFLFALLFGFLSNNSIYSQTTDTYTTPGSGSWTVPCGVTSVTVQVWGAGGAGGGSTNDGDEGAGGGGGGYSAKTFNVFYGQTINYTVGIGGNGSTGNGVFIIIPLLLSGDFPTINVVLSKV